MILSQVAKVVGDFIARNQSQILTAIGASGVIATAVTASRATLRAKEVLDADPAETRTEALKKVWKVYIPAIGVGAASIVCIVGAQVIQGNKIVAVTAAYKILETSANEYKEHVGSFLGDEEKKLDLESHIAKERIRKVETSGEGHTVFLPQQGGMVCLDAFSGRTFEKSTEEIRRAENDFNRELYGQAFMCVNEWYEYLGLDGIDAGNKVGWGADKPLRVNFSAVLNDHDTPVVVVSFETEPTYFHF